MIRYALRCSEDHVFESWFQSAEAFEALRKAGHVACPDCGSAKVEKALMAPQVRSARARPLRTEDRDRAARLAALKAHVEENCEYVGRRFAAEARAIHEGGAPERPIFGEASSGEASALIEDGIPVAPLPFVPARRLN